MRKPSHSVASELSVFSDFEAIDLADGQSVADSIESLEKLQRVESSTSSKGKDMEALLGDPTSAPSLAEVDRDAPGDEDAGASSKSAKFQEKLVMGQEFDPNHILSDIEQTTHKVADMASAAAKDVSQKLLSGATEAKTSFTRFATDVTSWWSSLEPIVPPTESTARKLPGAEGDGSSFERHFGLEDGEHLVEDFRCSLVQTYACTHNPFTQPQEISFPGRLYVTSRNTCFSSPGKQGGLVVVKMPLADISKVSSTSAAGKAAALRLEFGAKEHLLLQDFDKGKALDDALALIEHYAEGA